MTFHLLTIFPEFFAGPFEHGVVARAASSGMLKIEIRNLRDWTKDRHQIVDDRPFGGGEGMLLKPEPIFDAVEQIIPERTGQTRVVLLSAQGSRFTQATARRYATYSDLLLICGRYEGVDERVAQHLADEELSVGDYVLSGGELAAAIVVDATARLLPGVLGNSDSALNESFSQDGVLDCPQYTRPAEFRGWKVPEVLLNGNHEEIRRWRSAAAHAKGQRLSWTLTLTMSLASELASLFRRDLTRLTGELSSFSDAANLWDKPDGVPNSAGNLALHLDGNLREYIGRQLGNIPYERQRPLEFSSKDIPLQEILSRLEPLPELISGIVGALSPAALNEIYPEQVLGYPTTTSQFLIHLLGHLNYHLGQINYLRRTLANLTHG